MKNVLSRPLDELEPLVGEWSVEGRHVALPGVVIRGRSSFEWWGERTLLIHRSTLDHPDFPDAVAVVTATGPNGGLTEHYFDSRGVQRVSTMTFADGVWTLARTAVDAKDFDQRLDATVSADGTTIAAQSSRTEPGAHEMRPDFALTYTRLSQRAGHAAP